MVFTGVRASVSSSARVNIATLRITSLLAKTSKNPEASATITLLLSQQLPCSTSVLSGTNVSNVFILSAFYGSNKELNIVTAQLSVVILGSGGMGIGETKCVKQKVKEKIKQPKGC